jgi:DNA primase
VRGNPIGTVSAPVRWDEVDDCHPDDFTIATMPARFAERGDLHAGIDDAVFDIEPLRQWADRDEANGLTSTTGRGDGEDPVQEEDA